MLTAAIVGMGRWGRRLTDSIQERGKPKGRRIHIVVGVARTPDRARVYAEQQQLTLTSDYDAVLGDPDVQAVVLATPHDVHAEQIKRAAKAGKHVFVEKPLTLDRASAADAVAAASKAKIVLALGHNRRFLPTMRSLHSLTQDRKLGTPLHLEANFAGPFGFDYAPGAWRAEEEGPLGALTALGVHLIDSAIHLYGPIAAVRCVSRAGALAIEMDDTVSLLLRFANGATGYLSVSIATAAQWRIQTFGSTGWAHMTDPTTLQICHSGKPPQATTHPGIDIERAELEAFADAVAGEAAYPLPPNEAVHGVAVLEAALTSARTDGAEAAVA